MKKIIKKLKLPKNLKVSLCCGAPVTSGDFKQSLYSWGYEGHDICVACRKPCKCKKSKRKNSKRKGATGELELSKLFNSHGLESHRSQQYKGSSISADVEFDDPRLNSMLHVECKRCQHLNLEDTLQKAESERPVGSWPIICHRKNGNSIKKDHWKVTMYFEDWIDLFKSWYELTQK